MAEPDRHRIVRLRRRRSSRAIRRMTREITLSPANLIYPIFVTRCGTGPINSMPGVSRVDIHGAVEVASRAAELGLAGVLLFGIPRSKAPGGQMACKADAVVPAAVRAIKKAGSNIAVITDVCLCSYTDTGHCGMLAEDGRGVDNDRTLPWLARMAQVHADSGADIVAPSAMMDHQVSALRQGLDSQGHSEVSIMSYSVKYASAFYGPFRDAADGSPRFGDRRTHQMDCCNAREALREAQQDIDEGADFLMVKPALAYLDVVRRIRERMEGIPLAAYNVSGEYAMVKAAAEAGLINEQAVVMEILHSIRRAGADLVITYHALDAARWLHHQA
ncbi:MAG: porphobilinogen synthase [Bacteroidota bacterium]|nr:porphobilinogen synthase [Bacteroidota bacterium]